MSIFISEREPLEFPPSWASAWGDDRFGLWAEFTVAGMVQRMRWIEPGEFTMGSPDKERKRIESERFRKLCDDEAPPHRVRLTEGFWLAETACTQALWLGVVGGENPSRFTGDDRLPVEQVSWDDVMENFVPKLQALLPAGVHAGLPTEVQWEYACRAGTDTAFSFGDMVTSEQVNFDGSQPYGGAPESEYRERTVAVGSLPANGWGLHEMHGNVVEWCADGMRAYEEVKPGQGVENPTGPQELGPQALRAVRGGSWIYGARSARSATRLAFARDDRDGNLGFRLLLRSTGRARSGEAPEGRSGGEPAAAPEAARPA